MKKLIKLSFIVFIPFVGGLITTLVGSFTKNETVINIGMMIMSIGIPVTMFALVVIGLVLIMTGRLNDGERPPRNRKTEQAEIDEVNSSYGYESKLREAEYISRHAAENYKNSTDKEKALGWLYFGFLMTDFALILVFAFSDIMLGALICFCIFVGTIILSVIIKVILEKTSMSFKPRRRKKRRQFHCGEVKACLLSGTTSTGSSNRHSATRIVNVTYRVIINSKGKEYTAYSDKFFETGELVVFELKGCRLASIVDREQLAEEVERLKKQLGTDESGEA